MKIQVIRQNNLICVVQGQVSVGMDPTFGALLDAIIEEVPEEFDWNRFTVIADLKHEAMTQVMTVVFTKETPL